MSKKIHPYSAYKKTGIKWMDSVPNNWQVKPIKYVVTCNDDVLSEGTPKDFEIKYVEVGGVSEQLGIEFFSTLEFGDAPSRARRLVAHGDTIVSTVRTYLRAIAPVIRPPENLVVSTGFAVIRPKDIHSDFARYLLSTEYFMSEVISHSTGVSYPAINTPDLMNIKVAIPSPKEQEAIAIFLNKETGKIDELIQKQEKLIELIQELQQAKILMCVTRGIKPVAKLKKSTNIWLDEIPSSWGEGNLKVLSKIYSGGTPDKSKQEYWTNGTIPWLNSGSVNDFYIFEPSEYITVEALSKSSAKWIKSGSVLVALAGQGKTKGMAAQLMFDSTCNQSMCAIVPSEKLNSNYLLWWLSANYQNIRNLAGGDLRDGLNLEMIGSIKCPLPSINEQIEIAKYLDSVKEKNLHLIERCKKSIELLTEHRSSLISAAVTGKIDVREVA